MLKLWFRTTSISTAVSSMAWPSSGDLTERGRGWRSGVPHIGESGGPSVSRVRRTNPPTDR
jgi:hypothetical protein